MITTLLVRLGLSAAAPPLTSIGAIVRELVEKGERAKVAAARAK